MKNRQLILRTCLTNSLLQQINQREKEVTNQVTAEFRRNCNQVKTEVKTYIHQLLTGLEMISKELNASKSNLEEQVNYLNCAYGKRTIDWSQKYYEPLTQDGINREVVSVTREIGKSITIEAKNNFTMLRSQKELDSILQEKVVIQVNEIPLEAEKTLEVVSEPITNSSIELIKQDSSQEAVEAVTNHVSELLLEIGLKELPEFSTVTAEELINKALANTFPKLNRSLEIKQWKEAETITFSFLSYLINAPQTEGWEEKNITESYFPILQQLDQSWRSHSEGKYGLTVQQGTYQNPVNHHLASWYKVGVDYQQDDQLFFPLYSKFYLSKLRPQVNLDLREKLLKIETDWEGLRKEHNESMKKIKALQKATLQYIDQRNKELAGITYATQKNYRDRAKKIQDKLEQLVQLTEQLFSQ